MRSRVTENCWPTSLSVLRRTDLGPKRRAIFLKLLVLEEEKLGHYSEKLGHYSSEYLTKLDGHSGPNRSGVLFVVLQLIAPSAKLASKR
jgi:hypothetical protein